MTGPCAKVRVFCTLVHPDGRRWTGENVVRRPQAQCPAGTASVAPGYELCRDVCDQVGHAEVVALRAAGTDAAGSTAYVEGRDFVCYDCQAQMVAAGVRRFVLDPPCTSNKDRILHALPATPSELAVRLNLSRATICKWLGHLRKAGLVMMGETRPSARRPHQVWIRANSIAVDPLQNALFNHWRKP